MQLCGIRKFRLGALFQRSQATSIKCIRKNRIKHQICLLKITFLLKNIAPILVAICLCIILIFLYFLLYQFFLGCERSLISASFSFLLLQITLSFTISLCLCSDIHLYRRIKNVIPCLLRSSFLQYVLCVLNSLGPLLALYVPEFSIYLSVLEIGANHCKCYSCTVTSGRLIPAICPVVCRETN